MGHYPKSVSLILIGYFAFSACRHTEVRETPSELEVSKSEIPSTMDGVTLNGAHEVVSENGKLKVMRSQAPLTATHFNELKKLKITDVVIFKNETGHEVTTEMEQLKAMGLIESHIKHIPFPYKNFPDFATPCQQTIEALKFIKAGREATDRKVLFHCTVGEDRTGYLAGVVRLLETQDSPNTIFKNEMCKNGYSSGNPHKHRAITGVIDRDLTPLYLKMAYLIRSGKMSWSKLNAATLCAADPVEDAAFAKDPALSDVSTYKCSGSSLSR